MPVYILSSDDIRFPPPEEAEENGLLAVGGDLSPARLILAYRMGIFPWYSEGEPILWWSPDPRMILFPYKIKISHSLRRVLKNKRYQVTFNKDFPAVIECCQKARLDKGESTWITSDMKKAYMELHSLGYACSVETWENEKLVGGLYGVIVGNCFCGESMFSIKPDSSKVALVALAEKFAGIPGAVIDCQIPSRHLERMGAEVVSRVQFLFLLNKALGNA